MSLAAEPQNSSAAAVPEHRSVDGPAPMFLVLQLLLAVLVVRLFEIEERRGFLPVLVIAVIGSLIHTGLPHRWRSVWLLSLTSAALVIFVGPLGALSVLGIGGMLIGVCYLPLPFRFRTAILLAVGLGVAHFRSGSADPFWPILGSMFMFRLIVFMYDTRHLPQPPPLRESLPYFFLLPNVCFVLFPVVDYSTYQRTREEKVSLTNWQTGINWIVLGIVHLLIYRAIRYWILPPPRLIDNVNTLLLFLAANYGLYLRVAGQFHIIVGILHLFGFGLPRTHDWFFFASSLTDIWRRINIYWKDFMSKLFFMPAFFRLRRVCGDPAAVVLAVCWVFLATWLAHAWQVFWLLGEFPLTLLDAQLWGAAGVIVGINALLDYRRARRPVDERKSFSVTRALKRAVQTVGTFLIVSLFWARWSNPDLLVNLRDEVGLAYFLDPPQLMKAAGILAAVVAGGVLIQAVLANRRQPDHAAAPGRRIPVNVAVMIALLAATLPALHDAVPFEITRVLRSMQTDSYTKTEASQLVQGYYEDLNEGSAQAGLFLSNRPRDVGMDERRRHFMDFTRPRRDILRLELIPSYQDDYEGGTITINRWGMRSREIERAKPEGVRRIALLGSSVVMGYGVSDDETFAYRLEKSLNEPFPPDQPAWEVLNFGVGKYHAIHRRAQLEQKVIAFDPDVVLYIAHQDEWLGPVEDLAALVSGGLVDDRCLKELVEAAGVTQGMPTGVVTNRLRQHAPQIVHCCYDRIVAACLEHGIQPVWVYLPIPAENEAPAPAGAMEEIARESGFAVLDLSDWAAGHETADVKIAPSDYHANVLGHQLIGARLEREIEAHPEIFRPGQVARQLPK